MVKGGFTFKMLGSSHIYQLNMENANILIWDFANIQLPDSFSNEPGSHGHINFSIKPKANRPLGTVVENSAAIYFDFNAPVITNTSMITYDVTISNTPANLAESTIRIFPHPVVDHAIVEYQRYNGKPWTFEVFELQGRRLLHVAELSNSTYEFDRSALPDGTYFYKVTSSGSIGKAGKLILR